ALNGDVAVLVHDDLGLARFDVDFVLGYQLDLFRLQHVFFLHRLVVLPADLFLQILADLDDATALRRFGQVPPARDRLAPADGLRRGRADRFEFRPADGFRHGGADGDRQEAADRQLHRATDGLRVVDRDRLRQRLRNHDRHGAVDAFRVLPDDVDRLV